MSTSISDLTNSLNEVFGWLNWNNRLEDEHFCILREQDMHAEVVVPIIHNARQFSAGVEWLHEAITGEHVTQVSLPKAFWITDAEKGTTICAVEPKISGSSESYPHGSTIQSCSFIPKFLVKGNIGIDYSSINCLKTSALTYRQWFGISSVHIEYKTNKEQRECIVKIAGLGPRENLADGNQWALYVVAGASKTTDDTDNTITIKETVSLVSESSQLLSYDEHFVIHEWMNNLISIMNWQYIPYDRVMVKVLSDQEKTSTKDHQPAQYHLVAYPGYKQESGAPSVARLTVPYARYSDIGSEGIRTWFDKRGSLQKPVDDLASLASGWNHTSLENKVLNTCISFEELANRMHLLELSNQTGHASIRECIGVVLAHCNAIATTMSTAEQDACSKHIADTYNSIKHPGESRSGKPRSHWLHPQNLVLVSNACRIMVQDYFASILGADLGYRQRALMLLGNPFTQLARLTS